MRVIAAVFLFLVVIGVLKSCADSNHATPTVSRADKMCADQGYAWVMAGNFVKRELKSPDSAKFGHKPDAYSYLGECRHSIIGSVDSQNSFGAMLRTRFSVTMVYLKSENKWRADHLAFH